MSSKSKSNDFVSVLDKVVKSTTRRARAKSVHNLAEMDGVAKAASPAADGTGKRIDNKLLIKAAEESLLRGLQGEKNGRLAFSYLKAIGALEKFLTEPQDLRTEEEKSIDCRAKIMLGLMRIAILRAEDFNSPIDLTDEESVRNHELKLVPVGKERDDGDKPRPITRKVPDAASLQGPPEPSPTAPSGPPGEELEDEEES